MMADRKTIDVLGLGVVAVDDLIFVPAYPPADAKIPISRRERHCGGLTATALVAAVRLGCRCSYAGVLGDDELSQYVITRLSLEGIKFDHLIRRKSAQPIHSTIIVDEGRKTRNIFFDLHGFVGADDDLPGAEIIQSARVLFVDYLSPKGMLRAVRIARQAAIPVVGDLEGKGSPWVEELLDQVDHLIVSQAFAASLTGESDPAAATRRLWRSGRQVVITTCGAEGCWYVSESHIEAPIHFPAFPIKAVDTTGCGDVFHGAYAAGLIHGMNLVERVQLASAAAAMKALRAGGQEGIPNFDAVKAFLKGERHHESQ
ncbi:MAG: PfkB family carbohydrate kinase [Terriglobia bacterium]